MKHLQLVVNVALLPLLIVVAFLIAFLLLKSRETPEKRTPPSAVPVVQVTRNELVTVTPKVESFGSSRAYLETALAFQVSGQIVELAPDFDVGRTIKKGQLLARIDATDYEAQLAEREGSLAQAVSTLADEEARAQIAADDWIESGRALSRASDLALRKPQLASAKAQVISAKSAVDKARIDLERTEIRAPYDAVITSRETAPGNLATVGAVIGTLISRDRIEVELPLTPRQVRLMGFEELQSGSIEVALTTPARPGLQWTGRVRRINPEIDSTNRTLRVIAEIENPFDGEGRKLAVGAFLNADMPAKPISHVIELVESQIVDDSFVWVVGENDTLAKCEISIVHTDEGLVVARADGIEKKRELRIILRPLPSFEEGAKVVVSDIVSPTEDQIPVLP